MGSTSPRRRSLCLLLLQHWISCWTAFSNWPCIMWLSHSIYRWLAVQWTGLNNIFRLIFHRFSSSLPANYVVYVYDKLLCWFKVKWHHIEQLRGMTTDTFPDESYSVRWTPIDSPGMVKIFWIFKSVWFRLPQNVLFMASYLHPCSVLLCVWVLLMSPAVIRKELEQMKGLWLFLWLYILSVSSLQWKSQAVQHRQLQAGKYIAWLEISFWLLWSYLWVDASKTSLQLLLQEITNFVHTQCR